MVSNTQRRQTRQRIAHKQTRPAASTTWPWLAYIEAPEVQRKAETEARGVSRTKHAKSPGSFDHPHYFLPDKAIVALVYIFS